MLLSTCHSMRDTMALRVIPIIEDFMYQSYRHPRQSSLPSRVPKTATVSRPKCNQFVKRINEKPLANKASFGPSVCLEFIVDVRYIFSTSGGLCIHL
jgi:hypothetical protein